MSTASEVRAALVAAGFERSRRDPAGGFTVGFHDQKVHGRPALRVTAFAGDEVAAGVLARRLMYALVLSGFVVHLGRGAIFTVRLDADAGR